MKMMTKRTAFLCMALVTMMLAAACAAASSTENGEGSETNKSMSQWVTELPDGRIKFGLPQEGVPFETFVKGMSEYTGKIFLYDVTEVQHEKISMIGTKILGKKDLISFLQVLFFTHDMAIVPIDDGENEVLMLENVKTVSSIRNG